jgi:hypothetical protein
VWEAQRLLLMDGAACASSQLALGLRFFPLCSLTFSFGPQSAVQRDGRHRRRRTHSRPRWCSMVHSRKLVMLWRHHRACVYFRERDGVFASRGYNARIYRRRTRWRALVRRVQRELQSLTSERKLRNHDRPHDHVWRPHESVFCTRWIHQPVVRGGLLRDRHCGRTGRSVVVF